MNKSYMCAWMLIEHGADIHLPGKDGRTPAWIATNNGSHGILEDLIKAGCDVTQKDSDGTTLLDVAVRRGSRKCVNLLVDNGAILESQDSDGDTPLLNAAYFHEFQIILDLIEKGADIHAINNNTENIVHRAMLDNYKDGAKFKVIAPLCVKNKVDVNLKDNGLNTPLHVALTTLTEYDCEKRNAIQELIYCGADVNAVDADGDTPLHILAKCIQHFHQDIAETLLSAGANVNAVNADGDTPLHVLVSHKRYCWIRDMNVFLSAGADINIRNKRGYKLVHLLRLHGHRDLKRRLCEKRDVPPEDVNSLFLPNETVYEFIKRNIVFDNCIIMLLLAVFLIFVYEYDRLAARKNANIST